jgi:hypothetical protein
MIGFETFCRIQSFLSWIRRWGGGGGIALPFENGDFFLDFYLNVINYEGRNILYRICTSIRYLKV